MLYRSRYFVPFRSSIHNNNNIIVKLYVTYSICICRYEIYSIIFLHKRSFFLEDSVVVFSLEFIRHSWRHHLSLGLPVPKGPWRWRGRCIRCVKVTLAPSRWSDPLATLRTWANSRPLDCISHQYISRRSEHKTPRDNVFEEFPNLTPPHIDNIPCIQYKSR